MRSDEKLHALLISLGGACLALGVAGPDLKPLVVLPGSVFLFLTGVGATGLSVGLALSLKAAAFPVKNAIASVIFRQDSGRFTCLVVGRSSLPHLREFYSKYFGEDVPDLVLMDAWVTRCDSAFYALYRVRDSAPTTSVTEMVGSFKVLPLSKSGVSAIERGRATGATLLPEHIAKAGRTIYGYYVGDVAASGRFAKGMVMAYLLSACKPAVEKGVPIYARPLTPDGLRVMVRYGFEPVHGTAQQLSIGTLSRLRPDVAWADSITLPHRALSSRASPGSI
jgi:hypothetical protein